MTEAVVVIAAGEGRRLGGVAKALLPFSAERDYLARIIELADATRVVVVVGPPHEGAIRAKHDAHDDHTRDDHRVVDFVRNPDPARGMASSIAIGFASLVDGDAAFLWPVDHPFVRAETLRTLRDAIGDHEVARPRYRGRGGHPPLIARSAWPALAACGDVEGGARTVIAGLDVVDVEVDDPGVVRDVDTPEDLA